MKPNSKLTLVPMGLALTLSLALSGCGSNGTHAGSQTGSGPIKMALLGPMSGSFADVGQWLVHGSKAGLYEVNSHGGVMGRKITMVEADTAGDPVDAVPAWNKLASQHPTFEVGPTALTIEAVIQRYDPARLPDFTIAGSTELDNMNYKYVYRTGPSDSTLARAMAAYAIHKHLDHALVLFSNGVSSETLIPPLEAGYKAHGGHVVDTLTVTPDQTSYLSELEQVFNRPVKPDAILMQLGPNTSATVFKNLQELGHLNIPVIDTDNGTNIAVAKAMGMSTAAKLLTGMTGTSPTGPAFSEFLADYQAVYHTKKYLPLTPDVYDSIVIAALAMDAAKSTTPSVWINKVKDVSNPPGVACSTYAQCLSDLKAGKKINYQGASGPENFNNHHNVFSGWTVVKWTSSGHLTPVYSVSPATITQY